MALIDLIATGKEAEQLVQHAEDLQNQVDTAGLQHQNDVREIDDLTSKLAVATQLFERDEGEIIDLRTVIANDEAVVARRDATIESLGKQLAAFPNLQILDGYERNPIVTDVNNSALSVWSPRTGANIGGEKPSAYSAKMVNGQFTMSVTGIPPNPAQHWCDVLWANKRPALPDGVKQFALDFGVVPVLAGDPLRDPLSMQCLEFDTLCIQDSMEYNLSCQYVRSSGKIQIASGTPAPGKVQGGGWFDTGIVLTNFDLAARHTIRWVYGIDRIGKTCQYIAFILDGKRYDIDPKIGVQPAYPQPTWTRNLVILQLQQDVNSVGGSYTSVFDSIRYLYVN